MKPFGNNTKILISALIPLEHGKAIDESIIKGNYKSRSEFIREAVKEKLGEEK